MRIAVMKYARDPLALRQGKNILLERGIDKL
jgi:hypothetical protein